MFYAAIAGYKILFEIAQARILDIIYSYYKLEDSNEGYPSRVNGNKCTECIVKISKKLYAVFQERH
jgi:hypothetical protein